MPGNLAAQIEWKDGPMRLEFVVTSNGLEIHQDGRRLASATLDDNSTFSAPDLSVQWGRGVFGPLRGELIHYEVTTGK